MEYEYKGWDKEQWKLFYGKWTGALTFDPATQAPGAAGNDPAALAAANAVLASEGIGVFTWGANTWNGALKNAGKSPIAGQVNNLSQEMANLKDITLIGWSKGANLVMKYMNEAEGGRSLVDPKNVGLIAPPISKIGNTVAWTGKWTAGLERLAPVAPASFGAVHLCANNDIACAGRDIENARNYHAGLSGHGPHGQKAAQVYDALRIQFDHGAWGYGLDPARVRSVLMEP